MATIAVFLSIDAGRITPTLQAAAEGLDEAQKEAVLDFSSVLRLDCGALRALEELVCIADDKSVKIVLRGVNVDVYKVLKLVKLTHRFSFIS